jgi:repressor of nif and glnA expression
MIKKDKHTLAMEIVKLLIDSGLSISDQLKIINDVRQKLELCRKTGAEMKQYKLDLI